LHSHPTTLETQLAEGRDQFLAFVRRRLADPDLAEDVLQDAYVRAVSAAPELRDEERITAWFYRILRNAIVDAYRRRDVRDRRAAPLDAPDTDLPDEPSEEDDRILCACFRDLLPTLNPGYAELIETVELGDEPPEAAAQRLGVTPNNLKVRRHRARQALRKRLEETCRLCAAHGCLDCTCSPEGRHA
jgi:RNA polymerase sigma factor (sigma-70 family)